MKILCKAIKLLDKYGTCRKWCILVIMLSIISAGSYAQQALKISGKVTDTEGEPIPGVTVLIKNTTAGTITDLDGNFTITAQDEDDILVFSFIGYLSQEYQISGQRNMNVVLKVDIKEIDEIVITGYSVQRKETVTGAIVQVGGDKLARTASVNISNSLVGKVSGISSVQKSGEPGFEETTIRIRGVGTYAGDQNPLIVIDGIVRDLTSFNLLDPEDVESLSVLKDASSTAVYGVRGANGVIIVTTKRGKTGRMKVDVKSSYSFTRATELPDIVNSYDYALLFNEGLINDGKPLSHPNIYSEAELWKFENNRDFTPDELAAMNFLSDEEKQILLNTPAAFFGNTDYMQEIFGNAIAPQQKHSVNISGGTEIVNYYTSIGYADQRSLINDFELPNAPSNTGSNRTNFRSNFDFKMIKNTEISVSISGQLRKISIITDRNANQAIGGRYRDLILNVFEAPPYTGQGVYGDRVVNGYAGTFPMHPSKDKYKGKSPIAHMLERPQANIDETNLNSSLRVKHDMSYLIDGFSLRGAISYDHFFRKSLVIDKNIPTYRFFVDPTLAGEVQFYGGTRDPVSQWEDSWYKNRKLYIEGGVDFFKKIYNHTITALGLVTGEKYTAPGLTYAVPMGFYGLVGRVTYNYADRYLAEFNMGYNGSENFAPGKRFGFFPAVSAGWVLSNEPFFPDNNVVNWIKIRGSYGQTGNSNVGGDRFLYLPGTWGIRNYNLNGGTPYQGYFFGSSDGTTTNPAYAGLHEMTVGNPDVTWEKKDAFNLALELRFLNDRLSATVDLFKEERDNILTTLETISGTIGLARDVLPPVNLGRMSNKGYELQIDWRSKIGNYFHYGFGGLVSYAVNKIEYMAEPPYPYEWMNRTGFSYGQYKGFYNEGFYNSAEEVANHPYNDVDGNRVQGGDLRIVDINGDGKIDIHDEVPVGFSNVPRYTFSGNFQFGYKGFEILGTLTGSDQGTFWMNGYLNMPFRQDKSVPLGYMKDRWTLENYEAGTEIRFPRMSTNLISTQNSVLNGFWYRSTSHLKLKNIEISYSLDDLGFIERSNVSSLRIFLNAYNLYTWGGKELITGIDPELIQDQNTSEGIIYPLTRVINMGVSILF